MLPLNKPVGGSFHVQALVYQSRYENIIQSHRINDQARVLCFCRLGIGRRANSRRNRGQEGPSRSDGGIAGRVDTGLGLGEAEKG